MNRRKFSTITKQKVDESEAFMPIDTEKEDAISFRAISNVEGVDYVQYVITSANEIY